MSNGWKIKVTGTTVYVIDTTSAPYPIVLTTATWTDQGCRYEYGAYLRADTWAAIDEMIRSGAA